jgi:hypothetical protein
VQKYIDIPGSVTHELPPLLVHPAQEGTPLSEVVGMAAGIVEAEDMLGEMPADESLLAQRRFDLALNLAEQYMRLVSHWQWGIRFWSGSGSAKSHSRIAKRCAIYYTPMSGRTPAEAAS